jgi:hypothetical protein
MHHNDENLMGLPLVWARGKIRACCVTLVLLNLADPVDLSRPGAAKRQAGL